MSVFPHIRLSVRPHGTTRLPWNAFSCNLIPECFQNTVAKFQVSLTGITGTVHEDQYTFLIISRSVVLRMRNVSVKSCRRNQNKVYMQELFFPRKSSRRAVVWKNIVEADRPQVTLWRVRIACWIPKATNTHLECVIFIAFPLQQCFHERTSSVTLHVHYLSCLF